MNDAKAWRLNSTDEMLHQAATSLGSSRIVQVLWRFPAPVSEQALRAEWVRLNQGLLSRRSVAARFPGARRKWVMAANTEPLRLEQQPLTDATALEWIDTQVRVPLPVGSTALWRLAAAPYHSGCLVSLTVPHFRSDGLGLINALAARTASRQPSDIHYRSDAADALSQVTRAATHTARWSRELARNPRLRAQIGTALWHPSAAPTRPRSAPRFFTSTVIEVSSAQWLERARAHGGTANTLFLEIAANLVRAHVPRDARADIDVGIPMNLRRQADDERANALVVVPLTMPGGHANHSDLQRTRQATKCLLESSGEHSATLVPEPLWHLLPASFAAPLKNPGAQQTEVVASNFGQAPDALMHFAGGMADGIALRTMNVPGLVPDKARLRASLCLLQAGQQMTVTVTGIPDHYGDPASLHRKIVDEFAAWGLETRPWWSHHATKG